MKDDKGQCDFIGQYSKLVRLLSSVAALIDCAARLSFLLLICKNYKAH